MESQSQPTLSRLDRDVTLMTIMTIVIPSDTSSSHANLILTSISLDRVFLSHNQPRTQSSKALFLLQQDFLQHNRKALSERMTAKQRMERKQKEICFDFRFFSSIRLQFFATTRTVQTEFKVGFKLPAVCVPKSNNQNKTNGGVISQLNKKSSSRRIG